MRNTIINKITEYAERDKRVFMVTGDAGFGVLDEFKKKFPDNFINLGVAEQNMISFSAGMSLAGYKVYVYNIVPFVLYRCYEQVRNDICYQELPVTLIGIGSGLTYAPQGMTHYSVEDIALGRTMPNLTILSPCDPIEAKKCAEYAYRSKQPVYIRIAKSGEPVLHKKPVKDIESPIVLQEGEKVAVLFHGSIGIEVMQAANSTNCKPKIISVPMLQPLNFSFLENALEDIDTVLVVEEHFTVGGLGTIISEWLIEKKPALKLIKLGIKTEFIHDVKNNSGMREKYGISADNIRTQIEKVFQYG